MAAKDLLFITMSHNVSFMGKTWWMLMLVLRLLVLLLAGFTLFSDEQERFVCNTIQPCCSNVCFDVFAPVSVVRLWLFHLVLLCLPHVLFATYVVHNVLSHPYVGGFYCDRSRGGSPFALENSSRDPSPHKAPLHDLPRERGAPRFHCAYFLLVILRILLEVVFGASQFFLFGSSVPRSFHCYEAPCTSGVECYISRPTEKTLMLNSMLAVASLSVLLSLVDLVSSVKAMVTWRRRRREMLLEEMSKGEQSSVDTTTTTTEDSNVLSIRRIGPSGSSKNGLKHVPDEPLHTKATDGTAKLRTSRPPTPISAPVPTHSVLHSHLPPRPDRGPDPRMPTPTGIKKLDQSAPVGANSGQRSDSSESKDKRAWV
ncbi:gap junction delta-4 protein-like [Lycodopsis pacificus]